MAKFLVRRIIFLTLTLIFVSMAVFWITELGPGNIAINTLGNTITPEQEASFNAQNGLNDPPVTRYLRWVIGSDWQAEDLIGAQLVRRFDEQTERYIWWVVGEDGTYYQHVLQPDDPETTESEETVLRRELLSDGETTDAELGNDLWIPAREQRVVTVATDKEGELTVSERRLIEISDGSRVELERALTSNADGEYIIGEQTIDTSIMGETVVVDQQIEVFWGLTAPGSGFGQQAGLWIRGANETAEVLGQNAWNSFAGAPSYYIPLQRGLLRGDPGVSFKDRRPVIEVLPDRLRNTLILAGMAFVIIMPLALFLGIVAGLNEGQPSDRFLSISSLIATATPEFASGVFLILIFSTWLGWFPGAFVQSSGQSLFSKPAALVLPVMTLGLIELGYILRITRASMIEVMRTNYIRTAVLKGLPYRRIVVKHALRNALLAPITIIMLHINWLVGGIVVVETLFGFPGLGRYVLDAALFKDVFAVEAAAMVLVIIAVGTQLFADIIYTYLNPRIRYS